jgi:hypothetical protein
MIGQFPETVTLQKPRYWPLSRCSLSPGTFHPLGTVSGIQKSQNALDSFDLIGPDRAAIILLKEPL